MSKPIPNSVTSIKKKLYKFLKEGFPTFKIVVRHRNTWGNLPMRWEVFIYTGARIEGNVFQAYDHKDIVTEVLKKGIPDPRNNFMIRYWTSKAQRNSFKHQMPWLRDITYLRPL